MVAAMSTGMRVVLLVATLAAGASGVTPIEKVIQLLKDLQGKVEKQGAKEAAQYDKFACFCKNQAGFKADHIAKSEEKIKVLEADIEDLSADIKSLNGDITQLGKDIKQLKEDIEKATNKREEDHEEYLGKAKDLNAAIDACGEAIDALKDSKKQMKDADLDLAQLKATVFNVKVQQSPEAMAEALSLVRTAKKAAQGASGDKPAKFKYQSNKIIATLMELHDTFKSNKMQLDTDEFDAKDRHEKQVLGWSNEQTFKEKEKKEKETLVEQKTEEKTAAEESKDEETANKESDEKFTESLESSCEQKAKDWDQRSKARADELTALAQATEMLEQGALKQYNVNKKLVGLVKLAAKDPVSKVPAPVEKPKAKSSPSFLQLRSVGSSEGAVIQRVISSLDSAATRLKSPALVAVALKAQLQKDHFSNVRSLIKDLIAKLKADAEAEAKQKGFCDTEMAKAVNNRDDASEEQEKQNGIIAKKTSLSAEKTEEIESLSKEIAELNKALLEAKAQRAEEKADNSASVAEAKAGAAAVKDALVVLKGFYSFAQVNYKPPNSDRSGATVGDMAPEAFSGEYKGLGDSAKGIIGTLEVIQADFERTETTTTKQEEKAVKDHDKFVSDTEDDIKEKNQDKKDAIKAKDDAEAAIVQAKDELYDAEKLHASAEAELEKLSPMCVEGEETYAERVAKRREEIAALKDAYQILDDWKN